jgi:hypothetical protein
MNLGSTQRLVLGLLVAALWFPLLAWERALDHGWVAFMLVGMFTLPVTLLMAAPLVYLLRRRLSFTLCCTFGIALGGLLALADVLTGNWVAARGDALMGIPVGLISSILFWLIGVWRNRALTIAGGVRDA